MLRRVSLQVETEGDIQRIASETGSRISVTDCRDLNSKGMSMLLELEGEQAGVQNAIRALRRMEGMRNVYETEVNANKTLCLTVLDRPLLCGASLEAGIMCLQCVFNSKERPFTWQILVRRSDDLRSLISRLEGRGIGVKVTGVSLLDHEEILTGRQKEILSMAVSVGYFDFPRKVGLTELSERVGVKPSTLSEILRSAERKIMEHTVKDSKNSA